MERLISIFVLVIITIFPFANFAQSNYTPEDQTRAINMHFLGDQLKGIATYEPIRYDAIQYYFKSSFTVVSVTCPSCEVNMDEFFNSHLFDVSKFESSRLASEEYTFNYKDNFLVTLKSQDEMNAHLNSMNLEEVLSRKVNRPFPSWVEGGSQVDFVAYEKAVIEWEHDFPELFKTKYYSEGFYKISFLDFKALPHATKVEILNNPAGYLLVE